MREVRGVGVLWTVELVTDRCAKTPVDDVAIGPAEERPGRARPAAVTPTEDFVVDGVDGVVLVSACSGQGAKFAP
ncbi:MAG TPA: hypothetical protein VJ820_21165 [Propionibacteriaceae bacterium]|nr:hypothetical protein [Propionibacteriaceae bacterium]